MANCCYIAGMSFLEHRFIDFVAYTRTSLHRVDVVLLAPHWETMT